MPLTDVTIKSLMPSTKPFKKFDGEGLYIHVTPAGSKLWRYKYKFNGRSKIFSIGKYPLISLKEARQKRVGAQRLLAEGIDPSIAKQENKQNNNSSFGLIAEQWFKNNKPKWSKKYAATVWRRIEKNLLPNLKNRKINKITTGELLRVLRKIEQRGAIDTTHRAGQAASQIFIHAIACGLIENNPANDIVKALQVVQVKHLPAITKPVEVGELMRAIDGFQGTFVVECALKLLPYVFVRPGELRKAEWSEIDLKNCLWTIPVQRMKMKREHLVPLSKQALKILNNIHPLTGDGKYIFPSVRTDTNPLSNNTLNVALRRLGYSKEQMCAHGFRTTASTNLHEMGWKSEVVERQLAHVDKNAIRGIYNRAEYLDERIKMMQSWADCLDNWKSGAEVIPFRKAL
jgi:integrase